jgi:hypothetical protein
MDWRAAIRCKHRAWARYRCATWPTAVLRGSAAVVIPAALPLERDQAMVDQRSALLAAADTEVQAA